MKRHRSSAFSAGILAVVMAAAGLVSTTPAQAQTYKFGPSGQNPNYTLYIIISGRDVSISSAQAGTPGEDAINGPYTGVMNTDVPTEAGVQNDLNFVVNRRPELGPDLHTVLGWVSSSEFHINVVPTSQGMGPWTLTLESYTPIITVTYDANGATSGTAPGSQTKTPGVPLTLATNSGNLARTGYVFAGWNTAADGSGTNYDAGASYTNDELATFYAKWSAPGTVAAMGGTVTTSGAYRVHTFTSDGFLTVTDGGDVEYLIVGGGGGGGGGWQGGGGGAGGYLTGSATLSPGLHGVTVGAGGIGGTGYGVVQQLSSGGNSVFNSLTAIGGGHGANDDPASLPDTGGSGGGGSWTGSSGDGAAGLPGAAGTSGQGYAGGDGFAIDAGNLGAGGGGGSSGAGTTATAGVMQPAGGPGTVNSISGASVTYAAGGAGANRALVEHGVSGAANTGNGGSGGGGIDTTMATGGQGDAHGASVGGNGGSGIVIVRYIPLFIPTFTVTFDANGGSGTMSPQIRSAAGNLTANTFARSGYAFVGWNTVAGGGGTAYADSASYSFAADITLYAQWTPANTVTFDANGGSGTMSPQASPVNVAANLTLNTFTRTGYVLANWNTAADGSGTSYANGANYSFAANIALYAQWTAVPTYTVTYDANGATSGTAPGSQIKTHTLPLTLANNSGDLAKSFKTFAGWNTAADGSGTSYAAGASYTTDASVTLYAKWNDYVGVLATGGTVTTSDGYTIHTFTSSGTFTVTYTHGGGAVEYLVVGGGGGGGGGYQGGGGGAGGYLTGSAILSEGAYGVTVGAGGNGGQGYGGSIATSGGNSVFNSVTAIGGGFGASETASTVAPGTGGSGGGGAHNGGLTGAAGTAGQGNAGGDGFAIDGNNIGGGGGGGSSGAGTTATSGVMKPAGGPGTANTISGAPVTYAAGGAGANRLLNANGTNGAANTGNGGSGGGKPVGGSLGGNGGSGIVIVRYPATELPTYTVTFDANGGSGTMSPQTRSAAGNLTSNSFTRTGYTFAGWKTEADGSGTSYADGASYSFAASITLYAQWTGSIVDNDGDGMDDGWETTYLGGTNAAVGAAMEDRDGDGFSNLHEYIAGTDPTNAASLLKVGQVSPGAASNFVLDWASVAGKVYSVKWIANLMTPPWQTVASDIAATPPMNVYTGSVTGVGSGFYRVEVQH